MSDVPDPSSGAGEFLEQVNALSAGHRQHQIRVEVGGAHLAGSEAFGPYPARGELTGHL
jgi:hypothetical protein